MRQRSLALKEVLSQSHRVTVVMAQIVAGHQVTDPGTVAVDFEQKYPHTDPGRAARS